MSDNPNSINFPRYQFRISENNENVLKIIEETLNPLYPYKTEYVIKKTELLNRIIISNLETEKLIKLLDLITYELEMRKEI